MGHPNAIAILQALAKQHRQELEAAYRRILLDGLDLPEEQQLAWTDLTDPGVLTEDSQTDSIRLEARG